MLEGLTATATVGSMLARPSVAAPRTLKIGLIMPMTGPLALFTEHVPFVLDQVKRTYGGTLPINGTNHPFQILTKDSQSNPNRASEVALDLILKEKVDIMCAFATPETVNPVSDQCEANGVPCLSNDAPLEPWFFGRHGDPKKGFDWTCNFFFSAAQVVGSFMSVWDKLSVTKHLGVLWANDTDGNSFAQVMPPIFQKAGFTVVDPGRFDLPASNFNAQIAAFKSAKADAVLAVLPSPDFTTFWNEAARQAYRPRVVVPGKVAEFPPGVYPYGDRAINFAIEVWWSRFHPFSSTMTGQSCAELADEYEKVSNRQASMALGFRHSLLEVCFDVLKRTQDLDSPESIRDALRTTECKSIVGPINFSKGPFPNTAATPIVAGQWRKGTKWPLELVIVDNTGVPEVPLGGHPEPMPYGS
jgi:branched-chain amino acid transport system substrate-binding protein